VLGLEELSSSDCSLSYQFPE